jgi:hypothetical protein
VPVGIQGDAAGLPAARRTPAPPAPVGGQPSTPPAPRTSPMS